MVNMNVPYSRPNYSLTTLQNEIRARWPGQEKTLGFVTGYKSATNFTGHNADNNGICHAYDIGVGMPGGLHKDNAEWLANYLRLECNPRFAYLIYNRRIASNKTGFKWVPYAGASPHTDHIHISTVDLYWGEPSGVPASVYDSRAPWGVYPPKGSGAVAPVADKVQKIIDPLEDLLMDAKQRRELLDDIGEAVWDERMSGEGEPHLQARTHMIRAGRSLDRLEAQNVALTKAVTELAQNPAITPEALEAMLNKAVADFRVTLAPEVAK